MPGKSNFVLEKPAESSVACATGDAAPSAVGVASAQSHVMSESARQWLNVKNTPEGQEYIRRAKLIPPSDVATMSEEQRSNFLNLQHKKLSNLVLTTCYLIWLSKVIYSLNFI